MRRVRVGLIGLGSVFLLVMLSAALLRMSSDVPKTDNGAAVIDNRADAPPNEPLAQLGVAPGNPQPGNAAGPRVAPISTTTGKAGRR